jgi:hypothetical protein
MAQTITKRSLLWVVRLLVQVVFMAVLILPVLLALKVAKPQAERELRMQTLTRDKRGRFTKQPRKVNVSYDKETNLEHTLESFLRHKPKTRVMTHEELIEATRELETSSPIERAEKAVERRMRASFNRHYNIWVMGTVVGMFLMFEIGKYFAS